MLKTLLCTALLVVTCSAQGDDVTTESGDGTTEWTEPPVPSTTPRYVPYPAGGILVQYTRRGLDYIIRMIERATAKVLRDFPIPDAADSSFAITKIKVLHFDEPRITARFINQSGIEINTTIPALTTSAAYSTGAGWFGTSGVVRSDIKHLVVSMQAKIRRGSSGYPSIGIQECSGSVADFRVLFQDAGWAGTILNSLRMFMESIFVSAMGDVFCFAARNVTSLIETVFLDFDKPMSEILHKALVPDPNAPDAPVPGALDLKVICGEAPGGAEPAPVLKRKGAGGIASSVVAELEDLTMDMKMNDDGFFEDDQVVVGLRGAFLHRNKSSGLEPQPLVLRKTDRSLCFAVSEAMPNSFGVQAHDNGYFVLKKKLDVADLPLEIRAPLKLLCGKCNMQLYASTSEAPKIEFSSSGVRSTSRSFLRIDGRGIFNTKIKVVEGIADIETLIHLYVDRNTLYGNVSLGSIQVKIHDVGIGGVFDKPLNALLRKLIPKVVWPVVQKRLNRLLHEKGIPLPAVCGLSFNNTQLRYVPGSLVICTDFSYDLDGFLDRFAEHQLRQQGLTRPATAATPATPAEEGVPAEPLEPEVLQGTPPARPTTVRSLSRMDDGLTR